MNLKSFWEMTHEERSNLFKTDPQAFESSWKAELSLEEQRKMWRMQAELNKIKSPIERMNRAGALMYESLFRLNGVLNDKIDKK